MRIVMMGTGPFAVPTFRWLLHSPYDVPALITRPIPPPRGRQKAPPNPMRDVAESQGGLAILAPPDINAPEFQATLHDLHADLYVVCDYGQILSRETLGTAKWGGINLHASLLPRYRGAAPIHWALFHGESETGVTVIHMSPKLDAGPCLIQLRVKIEERETGTDLERRLSELGVTAVRDVVDHLALHGEFPPGVVQEDAIATRAPRLKKSDGQVDWTRSARQIQQQVQAFLPWPGVFTDWLRTDQPPLRLLLDRVSVSAETNESNAAPGTVLQVPQGSSPTPLLLQTGQGVLAVEALHPAGKHAMGAAEFQRGYRLSPGSRWGTSP